MPSSQFLGVQGNDDCLRRMLNDIRKNARILKRQTKTTRKIRKEINGCSLRREVKREPRK